MMADYLLQEPLPPAWSFCVTEDGRIFFVNDHRGVSTWLHPDFNTPIQTGHLSSPDLPLGFEYSYTPEGAKYYINHMTWITMFEEPVEPTQAWSEAPAPQRDRPPLIQPAYDTPPQELPPLTPTTPNTPTSPLSGDKKSKNKDPLQRNATFRKSGKSKVHSTPPTTKRSFYAPISMQGWLSRMESRSAWKRRWVIMSEFCIYFYKDKAEKVECGSILLPSYNLRRCLDKENITKLFAFKIDHNNMKTNYFAADSAAEFHDWMRAFTLSVTAQHDPEKEREFNNNDRPPQPYLTEQQLRGTASPGKRHSVEVPHSDDESGFRPRPAARRTLSENPPHPGEVDYDAGDSWRAGADPRYDESYLHDQPRSQSRPELQRNGPDYMSDRPESVPLRNRPDSSHPHHGPQKPPDLYGQDSRFANGPDVGDRPDSFAQDRPDSFARDRPHSSVENRPDIYGQNRPDSYAPDRPDSYAHKPDSFRQNRPDPFGGARPSAEDQLDYDKQRGVPSSLAYNQQVDQDNRQHHPEISNRHSAPEMNDRQYSYAPNTEHRSDPRYGPDDGRYPNEEDDVGAPSEMKKWPDSFQIDRTYDDDETLPKSLDRDRPIPKPRNLYGERNKDGRRTDNGQECGVEYQPRFRNAEQSPEGSGQSVASATRDSRQMENEESLQKQREYASRLSQIDPIYVQPHRRGDSDKREVDAQRSRAGDRDDKTRGLNRTTPDDAPKMTSTIAGIHAEALTSTPATYMNISQVGGVYNDTPLRPPLPASYRHQIIDDLASSKTPNTSQDYKMATMYEDHHREEPNVFQYPSETQPRLAHNEIGPDPIDGSHPDPHPGHRRSYTDGPGQRPGYHDNRESRIDELKYSRKTSEPSSRVLRAPSPERRQNDKTLRHGPTDYNYSDRYEQRTPDERDFRHPRIEETTERDGLKPGNLYPPQSAYRNNDREGFDRHSGDASKGNQSRENERLTGHSRFDPNPAGSFPDERGNFQRDNEKFRNDYPDYLAQQTAERKNLPGFGGETIPSYGHKGREEIPQDDRHVQHVPPGSPPMKRPQRNTKQNIQTVEEESGMLPGHILETKSVLPTYPLGGTRLRMSLCADNLLGKSHEELILLLIQLRRTKAGLEHARDFYRKQLDKIRENETEYRTRSAEGQLGDTSLEQNHVKYTELKSHSDDVETKLEVYKPLVNLVDNMVTMGSVYGGNNYMLATQYKKHLLRPDEYTPPKKMLEFSRDHQEGRMVSDREQDRQKLTSDEANLDDKTERLYELDRACQEQAAIMGSLKEDKDLLERALADVTKHIALSKDNPRDIESLTRQQRDIEEELSRAMQQLAEASKKLEETSAENRKIEHEVTLLRGRVNETEMDRSKSTPSLSRETSMARNRIEKDLARVDSMMAGLSQENVRLTSAMDTILSPDRQSSQTHAGPDGQRIKSKHSKSTYNETDLDTRMTTNIGLPASPQSPERINRFTTPPDATHNLSLDKVSSEPSWKRLNPKNQLRKEDVDLLRTMGGGEVRLPEARLPEARLPEALDNDEVILRRRDDRADPVPRGYHTRNHDYVNASVHHERPPYRVSLGDQVLRGRIEDSVGDGGYQVGARLRGKEGMYGDGLNDVGRQYESRDQWPSEPQVDSRSNQRYGEQDQRYGQRDQRFGEQDQRYGQPDQRYSEQDQQYGQQDQRFGQQDQRHGLPDKRYDQQDQQYDQQDQQYGQQDHRHGQQDLQNQRFSEQDQRYGQRDQRYGAQDRSFGQSDQRNDLDPNRYNLRDDRYSDNPSTAYAGHGGQNVAHDRNHQPHHLSETGGTRDADNFSSSRDGERNTERYVVNRAIQVDQTDPRADPYSEGLTVDVGDDEFKRGHVYSKSLLQPSSQPGVSQSQMPYQGVDRTVDTQYGVSDADDGSLQYNGQLSKDKVKAWTMRDVKRQSGQRRDKPRRDEDDAEDPRLRGPGDQQQTSYQPRDGHVFTAKFAEIKPTSSYRTPLYENLTRHDAPPGSFSERAKLHSSLPSIPQFGSRLSTDEMNKTEPDTNVNARASFNSFPQRRLGPKPFTPYGGGAGSTQPVSGYRKVEWSRDITPPKLKPAAAATAEKNHLPYHARLARWRKDSSGFPETSVMKVKRSPRRGARYMTISSSRPVTMETPTMKADIVDTVAGDLIRPVDMIPDIVRSSTTRQELFSEYCIDKELLRPEKVDIPERYMPDVTDDFTEEEKVWRQERSDRFKKLLTTSSIHDLSKSDPNLAGSRLHDEVSVWKKEREQLLSLKQELARQVTQKTRQVAEMAKPIDKDRRRMDHKITFLMGEVESVATERMQTNPSDGVDVA